jgi:ABC-type branched-subunit amino acid transport system substrate-binding protein
MAIDSLKTMGLNADVHFLDTKNDSAAVVGLLSKPEMSGMDMIIGPFFPKNQRLVASFCKKNKIRMICPVNSDSGILEGNRLVYASVPSNITLMRGLAKHMLENNRADNIVLVKPTKAIDKPLYDAFRDAFMELPVEGTRPALKESSIESLKHHIRRGVKTIFVLPSVDNQTAGKFMTTLTRSEFRSKPEDLYVYGTKEWVNFTDISGSYKNNYNLTFPAPNFLDYYTEEMIELNKKHRATYKTDLSRMAVQGYDVMMHFCSEFFLEKDAFQMMNDIQMTQISDSDGWENSKVFVVEQEEYELVNTANKDD